MTLRSGEERAVGLRLVVVLEDVMNEMIGYPDPGLDRVGRFA